MDEVLLDCETLMHTCLLPQNFCWLTTLGCCLMWCHGSAHVEAGDLIFKRHVINENTDYSAAALIDVNQDGRLDIVCGGDWYEAPHWERHFVADVPRIQGRPDGFSHLEFDVNRDGWTDVITVNYRSRSIKWMEHPGPELGPWSVHTAVEPGAMETGRLVDIDRDGQLDLLPNGAKFAAWFEFRWNDRVSRGEPAWIRHELPAEAGGHGLGFGDIDGDGKGDIVGQHGWLAAPENPRREPWAWHPEFDLERASIPILVVDADQDGDQDLVWCSAHGFGVFWHEQIVDERGDRRWLRHAIDTEWSQGHSPLWADMDGNGQPELIAGKRYMAHGGRDPGEYDPIVSFRYEFDLKHRTWQRWVISPPGDRVGMGLDPKIADIDADGDLDLLASGRSGLYWLENLGVGDSAELLPKNPDYENQPWLKLVDGRGKSTVVDDAESWGQKRWQLLRTLSHQLGELPSSQARVPLNWSLETSLSESAREGRSLELRFQVTSAMEAPARLYLPGAVQGPDVGARPANQTAAVLLMIEDTQPGLVEAYADYLTQAGLVCLVPEVTAWQELDAQEQVWLAMRGIDLLQAIPEVDPEKIGFVSDAHQGVLGTLLSAQDQRVLATVCDLSDTLDWGQYASATTVSLTETIATVAPRAIMLLESPHRLEQVAAASLQKRAQQVYELRAVPDRLRFQLGGLSTERVSAHCDWLKSLVVQGP